MKISIIINAIVWKLSWKVAYGAVFLLMRVTCNSYGHMLASLKALANYEISLNPTQYPQCL